MKCDDCPLNCTTNKNPDIILGESDCPDLTPANMTIINAMIAGEWRCETCVHYPDCVGHKVGWDMACNYWQPKEGGE